MFIVIMIPVDVLVFKMITIFAGRNNFMPHAQLKYEYEIY